MFRKVSDCLHRRDCSSNRSAILRAVDDESRSSGSQEEFDVPLIMASKAYKRHGIIVLWWDESEGGDTSEFRLPFMVISKDVHANAGGKPFARKVFLEKRVTVPSQDVITV